MVVNIGWFLCGVYMKLVMMLLIFVVLAAPACASENTSYKLNIESVYDGDTIKGYVDIWPGLTKRISVRINGIDAPEIRTKNKCEKSLGLKAKHALVDFIGKRQVFVLNIRQGKYAGRVLADVLAEGESVADYMISHGYAREYHGGKRAGWCE